MGFFDDLFGGSARKDIRKGRERATSTVDRYYDLARSASKDWYDRSLTFLEPQLEAGNRALTTEQAHLGCLSRRLGRRRWAPTPPRPATPSSSMSA